MTSSLPPPDIMDSSGRLRRLAIALFVGAGAAVIAYLIADAMAKPDLHAMRQQGGLYSNQGAYKFVYYVTALAGCVVFLISLKVLNLLADKKYRASLGPPQARTIER